MAPHALLIPLGAEGHWGPMRVVLRQLVEQGISFTLFNRQELIADMQSLKDRGEFQGVDRVELVVAFDELVHLKNPSMAKTMKHMREEFFSHPFGMENLIIQKSQGTGPTFILSDMFNSWTQEVADELGIPRYAFFPSPCSFALLCLHGTKTIDEGWYPQNSDKGKREEFLNLPGLENYRGIDVLPEWRDSRDALEEHVEHMPKAAGFLLNSFHELHVDETIALERLLRTLANDGKVPRVFYVGPLLRFPSFLQVKSKDELAKPKEESRCLQFLDSQPAASVLYICFGSLWNLSSSAMTELARGLEISREPFLWVVRPPVDAPPSWTFSDVLPEGFESRTSGSGLIWMGWSPQKEVLKHPSVRGFLSHCGWNSVLEAVCYGVPIIPWPLFAEQAMNARFLVSTVKVAIEIEGVADDEIVGEEIAKAIQGLMASKKGDEIRLRMQMLKNAAASALLEGGSSYQGLQNFLKEVKQ